MCLFICNNILYLSPRYLIIIANNRSLLSYSLFTGNQGKGAKINSPIADVINPTAIIDQWLLYLSARYPQNGLDIPYSIEQNRNTSPTSSVDTPICEIV